jgi:hypothetical protein
LLTKAAQEAGLNPWHLGRIASTDHFSLIERQTLFLGLSDGARTDFFRRSNQNLSHEQVRQSHELAPERVDKLLKKLCEGVKGIIKREPNEDMCRFRTVVLLDDFSGSGLSYLRHDENGAPDGKVASFIMSVFDRSNPAAKLVDLSDLEVFVTLYMATEHANRYLEAELAKLCSTRAITSQVLVVHSLSENIRVTKGQHPVLDAILDNYYDKTNETDSTRLGGTDLRYGFAGCGLPVILSHNTPNNSLGLLWAEGPNMRPLFPRITRHKDRV